MEESMGFSKIKIRKMNIADYDDLIKLWNEAGLPYRPRGRDRKNKISIELKNPATNILLMEYEHNIIGSIFATHDGRKGWINRLVIAPEFRNKGLAQKLIAEAENFLVQQGIEIIACLIENWNKQSMKLFQKAGYKKHTDIIYFTKRLNPDV
jgi:ribosomal protein S18 acetylase RimI-like enzyme